MIYGVNGSPLTAAYDSGGERVAQAYDIDGNPLLTPDLVVMTYNVEWFTGINANTAMQKSIMDELEPDIVGWQELQPKSSSSIPSTMLNAILPNHTHMMGDFGNKNGFSTNIQMSDFTTVPFTHQANESSNWDGQSYSTATITVKGKEIFVVVAHNTTHTIGGEELVCEQALEVLSALQGHEYFILLCDLNTVLRSTDHWQWAGFMEDFYEAGYNIVNCVPKNGEFVDIGTYTSGHGEKSWWPNDNIMTSSNIIIMDYVADQSQKLAVASQTEQKIDHIPLVARLVIN